MDGRVVRIAGNPLYPVNRGGLCMKGLAGTQVLYDPDRIRTPLERDGERGSGRWQPIAWDEALDKVAARLGAWRAEGQAHTVAVLGGQYRGLIDPLLRRFCTAYGTPNYLRLRCLTPERAAPSHWAQHGLEAPLCYDLAQSRFILSFGCNLLESWQATVHQLQAYGRLRESREGGQAQLVQVDPRYSVTAAKADYWIPIRPGTDGALAMGLASIIIQEGLYDRRFVQEQTFGFEDWRDGEGRTHTGFSTLVLDEYPPEKVAEITRVPVERLFRLARDFARHRPAVAIGEKGPPFHAHDLYTRMAVHSLNALVGSIGVPGGIFRQGGVPALPWETLEPDDAGRQGMAQPRIGGGGLPGLGGESSQGALPAAIRDGKPYGLNALFLHFVNPLYSQPDREGWRAALAQVPLLVSFSPFLDETTAQADLILPDHTYLERWQDDQVTHLAGMTLFGIGRPVVPPVHDTRQTEDVLLALAKRLGGPPADALPWETFDALLYERALDLFEAGRGHVVMPPQEEAFEAILTRQGFWQSRFEDFDTFWEALLQRGAWWDPNDAYVGRRQLFQTPSGKFEFYAQTLRDRLLCIAAERSGGGKTAAMGELEALARELGLRGRGDLLFMPHYENLGAADEDEAYPYFLNTYKLMSHAGGRGASQPWLQQQPAVHVEGGWESWVEINPATAAEHGIAEGDPVWLESPRGRLRVRATLYPGAMPQVLSLPFGQGHRAYGRWARGRGVNPNDLMTVTEDPLSGLPLWGATRVRLQKA
jgi:anaerobic selenocysteine-containing dehydrogenase